MYILLKKCEKTNCMKIIYKEEESSLDLNLHKNI